MKSIVSNGQIIGIIFNHDFKKQNDHDSIGVYNMSLGFVLHIKGSKIKPYLHNLLLGNTQYTQESLVIGHGKVRIDFYDNDRNYVESSILEDGDVVLLAAGGHGLEMIEDSCISESSQNPFKSEESYHGFPELDGSEIIIK